MAGLVVLATLAIIVQPGSSALASKSKPAKTTPTTRPTGPATLDPRTLAAAVQASALPVAVAAGAILGLASCPSGVVPKPGTVVQCVVGFDSVPVPYLVQLLGDTAFEATPTFPVVLQADVESKASALSKGPVRCGTGRVLVVPPNSEITCQKGKATVTYRVGGDGSLTPVASTTSTAAQTRTRSK